jgi:hypothetical protein
VVTVFFFWSFMENTLDASRSIEWGVCHVSPPFLWQRVTPVMLGWFAGPKWKNKHKWHIELPKLLWIFIAYTKLTNEVAGLIQPGWPRFGDLWCTEWRQTDWLTDYPTI